MVDLTELQWFKLETNYNVGVTFYSVLGDVRSSTEFGRPQNKVHTLLSQSLQIGICIPFSGGKIWWVQLTQVIVCVLHSCQEPISGVSG